MGWVYLGAWDSHSGRLSINDGEVLFSIGYWKRDLHNIQDSFPFSRVFFLPMEVYLSASPPATKRAQADKLLTTSRFYQSHMVHCEALSHHRQQSKKGQRTLWPGWNMIINGWPQAARELWIGGHLLLFFAFFTKTASQCVSALTIGLPGNNLISGYFLLWTPDPVVLDGCILEPEQVFWELAVLQISCFSYWWLCFLKKPSQQY